MSTGRKEAIQVELEPDQVAALQALSERRHVPITELVRESVNRLLADVSVDDDPLWELIGIVKDGPADMAEHHDDYLHEMFQQDNR